MYAIFTAYTSVSHSFCFFFPLFFSSPSLPIGMGVGDYGFLFLVFFSTCLSSFYIELIITREGFFFRICSDPYLIAVLQFRKDGYSGIFLSYNDRQKYGK